MCSSTSENPISRWVTTVAENATEILETATVIEIVIVTEMIATVVVMIGGEIIVMGAVMEGAVTIDMMSATTGEVHAVVTDPPFHIVVMVRNTQRISVMGKV